MIDLHCHVLPGLDDGPREMAESVAMCRAAADDGTSCLVVTPHMFDGTYNVTRSEILDNIPPLAAALCEAGVAVDILPGGDVHAHAELPELCRAGEVMTVADGGKYLLVEISQQVVPPHLRDMLFSLQLMGLTPILTHPERHPEIQRNPDLLLPIVEAGNMIQVTAASLTGGFGGAARRCVEVLVKRRMAHVVASDAHSLRGRPPGLSRARAAVKLLAGAEEATRIFDETPARVLRGENVAMPEPLKAPASKRRGFWSRLSMR